jgi:hypothetical protein
MFFPCLWDGLEFTAQTGLGLLVILLVFLSEDAGSSSVLALALGVHSSAAVPRPSASSFMPLRYAHQAPGLRKGMVWGAMVVPLKSMVWCATVVLLPRLQELVDGVLSAAA